MTDAAIEQRETLTPRKDRSTQLLKRAISPVSPYMMATIPILNEASNMSKENLAEK